jgi:hypothetical protein
VLAERAAREVQAKRDFLVLALVLGPTWPGVVRGGVSGIGGATIGGVAFRFNVFGVGLVIIHDVASTMGEGKQQGHQDRFACETHSAVRNVDETEGGTGSCVCKPPALPNTSRLRVFMTQPYPPLTPPSLDMTEGLDGSYTYFACC